MKMRTWIRNLQRNILTFNKLCCFIAVVVKLLHEITYSTYTNYIYELILLWIGKINEYLSGLHTAFFFKSNPCFIFQEAKMSSVYALTGTVPLPKPEISRQTPFPKHCVLPK